MNTAVTGGELVVRTLEKAGVQRIFGLHGAHLETIFQACRNHGIPILDTRHEVAAGHAAEGYARATRKLGVAMVTAGPGFTNVITSIANAYLDRTPVLYLSGSAALRDAETNTLQAGIDQVAIARPITKWAHQVTTVQQLPRLRRPGHPPGDLRTHGPGAARPALRRAGAQVEEDRYRSPSRFPIAPLGAGPGSRHSARCSCCARHVAR